MYRIGGKIMNNLEKEKKLSCSNKKWVLNLIICPNCCIPFYIKANYKGTIYCPYCKRKQI